MEIIQKPKYSLIEMATYFLKLGTIGFGGPIALVEYMRRDLVEDRNWISEDEYKEGLALSQLAPGPLAAQLSIYLGYVHYRILGASLVSIAFILPSFVMVLAIGSAYKFFGGIPWMQALFYGIGAAVISIIALSSYKLTIKSIGKFNLDSFKLNWLLWLFFILAVTVTIITESENVFVFILAGLLYMSVKAPPKWFKKPTLNSFVLLTIGFVAFEASKLLNIGLFFAKAGTFVFGSGLAIVPFLHGGVVTEYHWLNEQQFLDAIAVAMITPGPVVITVGFIGYLVAGFSGACVAAMATFLPCYLITIGVAPYFKKVSKNTSIKAFVDGITAAVVGALVGAVVIIGLRTITDITSAVIALSALLVLIYFKKFKEPYIILLAGAVGLILKFMVW